MLSRAELEKVLDLIFEDMKNAGLATQSMVNDKDQILSAVRDALLENDTQLTWQDIRNENVQKKLMGTIVNTALHGPEKDGTYTVTKENNEFIESLDKDAEEKKSSSPALDKKLEAMLFLKIALDEIAEKNDKTSVDNLLKPFKKELTKNDDHPKKEELEEKVQKMEKELEKQVETTIRSENAGMDTRVAGSLQNPIVGTIFGNLTGMTNQTAADPNSLSALVLDITFNAGQSDPQGKENIARIDGLMTGALEAVSDSIGSLATTPSNKRE